MRTLRPLNRLFRSLDLAEGALDGPPRSTGYLAQHVKIAPARSHHFEFWQESWGAMAPQFRLSGSLVVPPGFCLRPDPRSGRAHPPRHPSNRKTRFSKREIADPSCRPRPGSRIGGGRSPDAKAGLHGSASLSSAQSLASRSVTRHQLHPLVAPQVLHFMHVPLRTKV